MLSATDVFHSALQDSEEEAAISIPMSHDELIARVESATTEALTFFSKEVLDQQQAKDQLTRL